MSKDKDEKINPAKVLLGDYMVRQDDINKEKKYSQVDLWGGIGTFFLISFVLGMILGAETEKWINLGFGLLCLIAYKHYSK